METELSVDYATLKKQLQEMTTEMEYWRLEAARLEKQYDYEISELNRELRYYKSSGRR